MENKINVAQLLKDCPQGMELDCAMWNNVRLKCVVLGFSYPIAITYPVGEELFTAELTEYGCWSLAENAKCVIFPKGKTTWEEFVPPCEFKDGDIIFTHAKCLWISIFQKTHNGEVMTYVDYDEDGKGLYPCDEGAANLCMEESIVSQRLATEEEKQKLFDAIKANGYKWNAETKTLEKIVPEFKVGDRIRHKNGHSLDVSILKINADCYTVKDFMGDQITIDFTHQDNYELVPNKFDLNTLKPFESKVLIRNSKDQYWIPAFWGFRAKDGYVTTFGYSNYCIPFEGNEHLFKTKDDSTDFYKTWE